MGLSEKETHTYNLHGVPGERGGRVSRVSHHDMAVTATLIKTPVLSYCQHSEIVKVSLRLI